jgi:hypothetical protein
LGGAEVVVAAGDEPALSYDPGMFLAKMFGKIGKMKMHQFGN